MRYRVLKEFAIAHDKKFEADKEIDEKDIPADKLKCALDNGWAEKIEEPTKVAPAPAKK